jgi:hypothetical protein
MSKLILVMTTQADRGRRRPRRVPATIPDDSFATLSGRRRPGAPLILESLKSPVYGSNASSEFFAGGFSHESKHTDKPCLNPVSQPDSGRRPD